MYYGEGCTYDIWSEDMKQENAYHMHVHCRAEAMGVTTFHNFMVIS